MTDPTVLIDIREHIATITLNRPDRLNAFNDQMLDEWDAALALAQTSADVRAIIVTGAGRGFCAGADTQKMASERDESGEDTNRPYATKARLMEKIHRIALRVDAIDKIVIGAINGAAVGAGMDMALQCDIRYAAASARFSEGYIKLGLVPGNGGCFYLPRIVGVSDALELLLTGDIIDAERALQIGLVSRVMPDADLLAAARELAARVAARPPVHTRLIKRAVYQGLQSDLRASLDLISSHAAMVRTLDDSAQAFQSRKDATPPEFTGS